MLKVMKVTDKGGKDRPTADTPVYILKDGKFFRTAFHSDGWSDQPDYLLGSDGRIYRTKNHPNGLGEMPDYEFGKDKKLYRTPDHPEGKLKTPEFEIND